MKRNKIETLACRDAFEHYYSLGESRSMQKVAIEVGKSLPTIKRYSVSFNWRTRVEQRDLSIADKVEKQTIATVVNSKARYREIIHDLTDEFVRAVADGKIKVRNILDFERIVRLDMELMGVSSDDEDDNLASLVDALQQSGYGDIKDPDAPAGGGEDNDS